MISRKEKIANYIKRPYNQGIKLSSTSVCGGMFKSELKLKSRSNQDAVYLPQHYVACRSPNKGQSDNPCLFKFSLSCLELCVLAISTAVQQKHRVFLPYCLLGELIPLKQSISIFQLNLESLLACSFKGPTRQRRRNFSLLPLSIAPFFLFLMEVNIRRLKYHSILMCHNSPLQSESWQTPRITSRKDITKQ